MVKLKTMQAFSNSDCAGFPIVSQSEQLEQQHRHTAVNESVCAFEGNCSPCKISSMTSSLVELDNNSRKSVHDYNKMGTHNKTLIYMDSKSNGS